MTVEFSEVKMTMLNGGRHAARAQRIAQLTCEYVRTLMERDVQQLRHSLTLAQLEVPPLTVPLDTMDDETVARASAAAIYQAWLARR